MSYWITIGTALISCAIAALTGIVLIPFLKKIHFGQTILEIGPKWHKSKQGTPIMGWIYVHNQQHNCGYNWIFALSFQKYGGYN